MGQGKQQEKTTSLIKKHIPIFGVHVKTFVCLCSSAPGRMHFEEKCSEDDENRRKEEEAGWGEMKRSCHANLQTPRTRQVWKGHSNKQQAQKYVLYIMNRLHAYMSNQAAIYISLILLKKLISKALAGWRIYFLKIEFTFFLFSFSVCCCNYYCSLLLSVCLGPCPKSLKPQFCIYTQSPLKSLWVCIGAVINLWKCYVNEV